MTSINRVTLSLALGLGTLGLSGCPEPTVPEDIFAPMGEVAPYATDAQRTDFDRGHDVALVRYTEDTGLGPHFNLSFCGGCHERPVLGGSAGRYRNFLLVQQVLADGSHAPVGVNGIQPQFDLDALRREDAAGATVSAFRNPIPFFGIGLLAELPESAILSNADPDDADGDGISGRPNYDRGFVGRMGRKAQTVSVEGFIRGPLFNHLGVTSNPLSDELKARLPVPSASMPVARTEGLVVDGIGVTIAAQAAAPDMPTVDEDGVPDPELSEADLFALVSFSMLLAVPPPDEPTPESEEGRMRFEDLGCDGCHVPTLAGPRGLIPAYSDLLLHDMGEALADGVVMGLATGSEFRTQPLWGIAAVAPYLHDGRADTLDQAIRFHGGEAEDARAAYESLDAAARATVIAFLESLGGREVRSEGLIPPGTPIAPVGADGGPTEALDAAGEAMFLRGRSVFDRDMAIEGGLGPRFNGDSCRACHFDSTVGGAGPVDVNVVRQAILDATGVPMAPSGGTMAHRFDVTPARPPIDAASDFFELRQTPPAFGLGLIASIPEAIIVANEDPSDADGDGISGRAHHLSDGRLGRFGWRADVPSVEEFTRDAMTNELGLTVPVEAGLTFGRSTDGDAASDPELSQPDLDALRFYLASLAPPPRTDPTDPLVVSGQAVFEDAGCAECHRTLMNGAGTEVPLYSDLLIHDVAPSGAVGIGSGDASGREFRTPPLWGIAGTGPYMHDGLAGTLDEAIARHESEGAAAASAVSALSAGDREALLRFLASL